MDKKRSEIRTESTKTVVEVNEDEFVYDSSNSADGVVQINMFELRRPMVERIKNAVNRMKKDSK